MKKKIMLLTLITMISINLFACGNKKDDLSNDQTTSQKETSKNSESNTKKDETQKDEVTTSTTGNTTGKESTPSTPLEVGQAGIASKNCTVDSKNHNVDVSLTNVIRGEEAKKIVDDYNSKKSAIKIASLDSSTLEYAVGEYTITVPNDFPSTDEKRPLANMQSEVTDLEGKGGINYDGISYIISTKDLSITSGFIEKGVPVKGRFVYTIPKGCTNYLIAFGNYNNTKAYFKGK